MRNAKGEEDPASITENEPKDDLQILSQNEPKIHSHLKTKQLMYTANDYLLHHAGLDTPVLRINSTNIWHIQHRNYDLEISYET
ncbi:hypothetical protein YC2023_070512 [Brassica napus]